MFPPKDVIRNYCTWLPAMMDCLLRTDGPVLEVGGGLGTAVLRAYCADYRRLTTVETNRDWRQWLLGCYSVNDWHVITDAIPDGQWDVALVDSAPASTRQPFIESLKGRAKLIVVHDVEPGNFEGYRYNFSGFSHVALWNDLLPHTAVLTSPPSRDS